MDDKEDSSNAWLCGMAVVIVGVVGILSIAAFSAGYYGKGGCWKHSGVTNGTVTYSDPKHADGSLVRFTCSPTLYVSGPKKKECKASVWEPDDLVTCREIESSTTTTTQAPSG